MSFLVSTMNDAPGYRVQTILGEVTGFDSRLIWLNLFYLAWIVLIPFSSEVLGEHGSQAAAVILYAVNLIGVVLIGIWMATDARRAGLTSIDPAAHAEQRRCIYICLVKRAGVLLDQLAHNFQVAELFERNVLQHIAN